MSSEIRQGDCRELMGQLAGDLVGSVVTDPPYGLGFMGKEWDHGVPGVPFWAEALRVLKPGGHLVAFGGTRTYHRLAVAIEDAGFEVRDCLMWLYGSGFPKSLDVSKAIDKAAGAEREVVGVRSTFRPNAPQNASDADPTGWQDRSAGTITAPATDAARQWEGWGTALKPAWEPIILARKPLSGTVAANVQEHGTGALNVDGCRIGTTKDVPASVSKHPRGSTNAEEWGYGEQDPSKCGGHNPNLGRWPANLVLDEEAARLLDEQSGDFGRSAYPGRPDLAGAYAGTSVPLNGVTNFGGARAGLSRTDEGGASRFFYTAKASAGERHYAGKNNHPTVKPVDLMRWLCRLVTPKGGLVLDPFMGSGSTGVAALAEGFTFLGFELDPAHVDVARRRIAGPLFATQETTA